MRGTAYPVNKALLRPILIAGVEKRLMMVNALICFPLIAITHLHMPACLFGVAVFIVLHSFFVMLAKKDAQYGELMRKASRFYMYPIYYAKSYVKTEAKA